MSDKDIPAYFKDWQSWGMDEPFEDLTGPYFFRRDPESGQYISGFIAGKQHMNGGGFLHGGLLMTFADYSLFTIAHDELNEEHAVTVSCQTEFLKGAAPDNEPVFAKGEVTRNTRSLIFVRGEIYYNDTTLATFNGIMKKIGKRDA